ncbi:hypothetical protein [Streptococcus sp. Marseille-Q8145]
MPNWNLKNFNNIYASLAESAYRDRPNGFSFEQLLPKEQKILNSGKSLVFDFSIDAKDKKGQVTQGGGTDLPNQGKVYLQPDNQGLLEDKNSGYNAYYVISYVFEVIQFDISKKIQNRANNFLGVARQKN